MFSNQGSHGWIAKRLSTLKKAPDSELSQVVEAIGFPMVLLDKELRVVLANSSFSHAFQVSEQEMENNPIYELGDGLWDISHLREPLEEIARGQFQAKEFDIDHQCPTNGLRRVRVSAYRVGRGGKSAATIILKFEDATDGAETEVGDEQAVNKLREAEERIADLRTAVDREADNRQKAEAARLRVQEDLKKTEARITDLQAALDKDAHDRQQADEKYHKAQKDLKKAEERIADLQKAKEKEHHHCRRTDAEHQKVHEELKKADERIAGLQEAVDKEHDERQKAEASLQQAQGGLKEAEERIANLDKALEKLKKADERIAGLQKAVDKEHDERQKAETSLQQAQGGLKEAEERIANLDKAHEKLKRGLDEQNKVKEVNRQTTEKLTKAEGHLADLEVKLQGELKERQKAEDAGRQTREKLKKVEDRLADMHSTNQKLKKELSELKKSKEASEQSQDHSKNQLRKSGKDFHDSNEQLQKELADSKLAEKAIREACRELKRTKEYMEAIIKGSPDPVISTDRYGNVVLFNKGAEDLLGYRADDVIGRSIWELYANEDQAKDVLNGIRKSGGADSPNEVILRGVDGNLIPVMVSASTVQNGEGDEAGTILFKKDLREQKDLEGKLKDFTEKDSLTNLCNRVFFTTKLKEEFQSMVHNDVPLSLMVLDIDHFRMINENHGHQGGDCYLEALAGFVVRSVRPADIVARYDGDELAVLLPDTPSSAAQAVAERLIETVASLKVPFGDTTVCCTISIGTVTSDSGSITNANDFLKAADNALYEAKQAGRNRVVVWSGGE